MRPSSISRLRMKPSTVKHSAVLYLLTSPFSPKRATRMGLASANWTKVLNHP